MKIRSVVFELAADGRIKSDELEDYNAAAEKAFSAMEDFKFLLRKAEDERKAAVDARNLMMHDVEKMKVILAMTGVTNEGQNKLMSFSLRFLRNFNRALVRNEVTLNSEEHFRSIEIAARWLARMIDRDKRNIQAIKIQKQLYKSKNETVKKIAANIMQHIANESEHIIEGLREGKSFDELKTKIKQHWYEELSGSYYIGSEKAGD